MLAGHQPQGERKGVSQEFNVDPMYSDFVSLM